MKKLADIPANSLESCKKLAGLAPKEKESPASGMARTEKTQPRSSPGFYDWGEFDIERYLKDNGFEINKINRGSRVLYRFNQCFFDASHGKNDAYIQKDSSGVLSYCCSHDHCNHTWEEFKQKVTGSKTLEKYLSNYDPNWQPGSKGGQVLNPQKPYLSITEKNRPRFNPAKMADFLTKIFDPILFEGEDFGNQFYRYDPGSGIWKFLPEAAIRQVCTKELGDFAKKNWILESIHLLENKTYRPVDELKTNSMWLNLKSGMFHIEEMRQEKHGPEYNSRVQLPVEYAETATCPLWLETLAQIFEDDLSKCDVLQEFFGYCLYPKIIFPCAMFGIGSGANGKGVVQKVLTAILGKENVSHIGLQRMSDRFGPIELKDKLLNTCGETASKALDVTNFKAIAAADSVQAEQKYLKDSTFIPIAKHLISMNAFPGIKDKTDAFFRRIIVLEYRNKFEGDQDDKTRFEKLIQELNGIFLWSLAGLKRVLEHERVSVPESVEQAKRRFRVRTNPVLLFVSEACLLPENGTRPENLRVLPPQLYNHYKKWCEDGKIQYLGKGNFYEQIETNFKVSRKRYRDATKEFFEGIDVLEDF